MKKLLLLFTFFALIATFPVLSQVTTSAINGKVLDENSQAMPGANVIAEHVPTGTMYGCSTDAQGFYRLPNMTVGGPYKITITFVGYEPYALENVYLGLGQTLKVDAQLKQTAVAINEVQVVGQSGGSYNPIDGNRTGAETVVSLQSIQSLPTVSRSLTDYTRLTPQASVNDLGGISIAGANNRYNSISIDGAVNNDVFGLSSQGTNGGQTGGTPISVDAIEQFQVALAPYDVRENGFNGASINAVTKRGTNTLKGSAYLVTRNQNLAGKTPGAIETTDRQKLPDFKSNVYGMTLGGPVIKNKLFFFVNAEFQKDRTPKPYNFSTYQGNSTADSLNLISQKLINSYGYDPGSYGDKTDELNSQKFLVKLDWNLSKVHKIMIRHSYVNDESLSTSSSGNTSINYANDGIKFPSITNSSAFELNSNWDKYSNKLVIGYTGVRDNRNPMGKDFPYLIINDGKGTIYAGSEQYSTANQLNQDIVTFTDNFNLYKGNHTFTFGLNVEYANVYNLFIRQNYGVYNYQNIKSFLDDAPVYQYSRTYSLVDDVTGDGSAAAAKFKVYNYGIYAQDEFQAGKNVKITFGLRADMQSFPTKPGAIAGFDTTLNKITAAGYDLKGAKSGEMPSNQILLSPRIGFNWDVMNNEKIQVRGGAGIFTSRLPLVWPGGVYTNNGLTVGGFSNLRNPMLNGSPLHFIADPYNQPIGTDLGYSLKVPSGEVNLFTKDFKFPQVFRTSLAVDAKMPFGTILTLEGIFSKTLNDAIYYNVNLQPSTSNVTGVDNRMTYSGKTIESAYSAIYLADNTHKGFAYNLTAQLQRPFANGVTASVAYTFGRSKAMNDNTSSQNSSQWRYMESVNGRNNLDLSFSDYDLGSRVVAYLSYKFTYFKHAATTVTLFYNGQSGNRFSWVYGNFGNVSKKSNYLINDDRSSNELIFVPKDQSQINLIDYTDSKGNLVTAGQQWSDLDAFIKSDKYLKSRRGKYAERNGDRLPFTHNIDLRLAQDLFINVGGTQHTIQATFDIFNFTNFLNKNWGTRYYESNDQYPLITFEGFQTGTTPQFTFAKSSSGSYKNVDDSGVTSSRWIAQFGIKYLF